MKRCRRRRWPWVLLLLWLLSCGTPDDPWTYGEVTERAFQPAHSIHHAGYYTDGGRTCIGGDAGFDWNGDYSMGGGGTRVCFDDPDVWHPAWDEHVDDRWRIRVAENSDGADGEAYEHHWIAVSEALYDACTVGRRYERLNQECVAT